MRIKALLNKAIVKFLPFEHQGTMVIPNAITPESVEAEVIHDGGGNDCPSLSKGTKVYVSRMVGEYFEYKGDKLCMIPRDALMMEAL